MAYHGAAAEGAGGPPAGKRCIRPVLEVDPKLRMVGTGVFGIDPAAGGLESQQGESMSTLVFRGIEGSNPLAFLAALGAGRICDLLWCGQGIRMRWIHDGGWRPEVSGLPVEDEAELCSALHKEAPWAPLEAFRRAWVPCLPTPTPKRPP